MPMIILLHLCPGIIVLFVALVFSSPIIGINLPLYLSLILSIILGLIPTEIVIIKFFAWKTKQKIKDVILFNKKSISKKTLPLIIVSSVITVIGLVALPNIESQLWGNTFNFIPDWFKIDGLNIT